MALAAADPAAQRQGLWRCPGGNRWLTLALVTVTAREPHGYGAHGGRRVAPAER
jgi:hypothetical protein